MAFIDYEYYIGEYIGTPIPPEDFALLAERACDIIDCITSGRAGKAAEKGCKKMISAAKKAACAQTEYLYSLGGTEYLGITGKELSREEIGNAAISYKHEKGVSYLGVPVSGLALMYLACGGLTAKGL
jgi:hypothetical protein